MSVAEEAADTLRVWTLPSWMFRASVAAIFMLCLAWTYAYVISPVLSYLSFTYLEPSRNIFLFAMMVGVLPTLFLSRIMRRTGDFVRWVLYYALYLPCVTIPPLMGRLHEDQVANLLLSLCTAFLIICIPYPHKEKGEGRPFAIRIKLRFFWQAFFIAYILFNLWMVAVFGPHLRLVSLADVYTQRAASDDVTRGSLVGYAAGALAGAFNPFLMAYGISRQRYSFFAIGAAGQLLVFATAALKSVAVSIVILPVFYFLLFRRPNTALSRIGIAFCLPAVLLALLAEGVYSGKATFIQAAFTLIYMRSFSMPGVLMGVYTEFFLTHPLTYFSHVNLLRGLIQYPYADALGNVIGAYMLPAGTPMDANAGFLMTDGMAALGFSGIVLSGVFCRLFILLFDVCVTKETLALSCCALLPVLISVTNTSLLSSMLTGGAALLSVFLYLYSRAIPDGSFSEGGRRDNGAMIAPAKIGGERPNPQFPAE